MIGTKRRNVSLRSDTEEAALQSKKVLGESPFQCPPAESSVKGGSTLPLDFKRALSSRQQVRALNSQFASWVQSQLQNHPDELWEDGVQDYLAHASRILEMFSDVVNWLKANSATAGNIPSVVAPTAEKKSTPEAKSEETKTPSDIPLGGLKKFVPSFGLGTSSSSQASPSSASLFSSPWTSSVFSTPSSLPGSNASSGLSSSSQASSQSTSLFASGVSSKSQSQSPLSGGNVSPWQSSVLNSPSPLSGANASSGLSSSNQGSVQSTSIFSSGDSSKCQSQSVLSGGKFNFGLSSNSQSMPQSTTSSAFSNSPPASSGPAAGSTTSSSSKLFNSNFGSFSTSFGSFTSSSGSFSNNKIQFSFGNQNMAPLNTAQAEDDNEEAEEQPSSPSLKKSEEKGIHVVHEVKCKLYMKSTDPADKDPWKDKGTGQLSIKCKDGENKGTKESKPTIIIRNDVGRILLNALLYSGIKLNTPKNNAIVAIFHTTGDNGSDKVEARTFLIRTRNQEDRDKLAEAIKEHAPSA